MGNGLVAILMGLSFGVGITTSGALLLWAKKKADRYPALGLIDLTDGVVEGCVFLNPVKIVAYQDQLEDIRANTFKAWQPQIVVIERKR